jgi:hypothetical protein
MILRCTSKELEDLIKLESRISELKKRVKGFNALEEDSALLLALARVLSDERDEDWP